MSNNAKSKTLETKYQEHDINHIFDYFIKGYKFPDNQKIKNWEANYDPRKGKVIFTLYVEDSTS